MISVSPTVHSSTLLSRKPTTGKRGRGSRMPCRSRNSSPNEAAPLAIRAFASLTPRRPSLILMRAAAASCSSGLGLPAAAAAARSASASSRSGPAPRMGGGAGARALSALGAGYACLRPLEAGQKVRGCCSAGFSFAHALAVPEQR